MPDPTLAEMPRDATLARRFWTYALPSILAMLVTGLYVVVDGIFVGHYVGSVGLAAINLAYPLVMVQIGLGAMLSMGAATRIAILQGAGKHGEAAQILAAALWMLALLGLVLSCTGLYLLEPLLRALGAAGEAELYRQTHDYLQWMLGGSVLVCGQILASYLLRNDGRPRLATTLLVLATLSNITLDYLFVGVLGHGLAGSAQATLISQSLMLGFTLAYFFSPYARLRLTTLRVVRLGWHLADMARLGLSSLLMELNLALVLLLHNWQLLIYDADTGVAAYAVAGYTETVFTLLAHGLAVGIQPLLGQAIGAAQPRQAHAILRYALTVVVGGGIAVWLIIQLWADAIAGLFAASDPVLLAAGSHALRLHLLALPFDGLVILGSIALQAMALTRPALLATLAKTVLLLPALYSLPLWWGLNGVWLAMPVVNLLVACWVGIVLWRQMQMLAGTEPALQTA
ncbi:MATE family efflux transporter [Rhodobacteraceae bacterium CH30]|nr:MATE family efflux transporter [Rhodobacteraceae bacterium CH30]